MTYNIPPSKFIRLTQNHKHAVPSASPLTLTDQELDELCPGLTQTGARLRRLQADGFARARIIDGRLVLERAHFEAVCRGEFAAGRKQGYHAPEVNVSRNRELPR